MKKLFSAQKAYSLIELTVVLAIMVLLLSVSTLGIISLRASLNLNNATQGLYNALQLARSYAINNVTAIKDSDPTQTPTVPTMYVITLNTSDKPVSLDYCYKADNVDVSMISTVDRSKAICGVAMNNVFENDISGVTIQGSTEKPCGEVGFLTGTGDIYVKKADSNQFWNYTNDSSNSSNAVCDYRLQSDDGVNNSSILIEIDANNQTIKKL